MSDKKKGLKILLTIICFIISLSICIFLPKEKTETITKNTTINETTSVSVIEEIKRPYWQLFLEWIAVGSVVAIIWIWHKELGINGILGVEGSEPKVEQQEPDLQLIPEPKTKNNKNTKIAESNTQKIKDELYKNKLDDFLVNYKQYGFFYARNFADYANMPLNKAEDILFDYVNKGNLRIDANPKQIFSFSDSYENQIINGIENYISTKKNIITKEIRYARIGDMEFDALFETDESIFLCEVKLFTGFIKNSNPLFFLRRIADCIKRFNKDHKFIVFGIGCKSDDEYNQAVRYSRSYAYNDKGIRLIILPVKIDFN